MGKVWLITGAGRGLGADLARAALAAGDRVVASGRDVTAVEAALGRSAELLPVRLDVTDAADAEQAVAAALAAYSRIDVLVNNAASFYAGFFEDLTPADIDAQLATGLIGPMNVTRAVLPVMRRQGSGHVMSISSGAGLSGFAFDSAYAAAKFGLEGWMESIAPEIEPFGIAATIVNPGFFRTELLTTQSTSYAASTVPAYADRHAQMVAFFEGMNGNQAGDPAKLAAALVTIAHLDRPPLRFIAGADAIGIAEQKARDLLAQADAFRELSTSLDHDPA